MSADAIGLIVGDGLLMAGTIAAAVVTSRRAANRAEAAVDAHAEQTGRRLDKIERHTDDRLDRKIEGAVHELAREHPGLITTAVATDAARELLRGLIVGIAEYEEDDDVDTYFGRRRAHDR